MKIVIVDDTSIKIESFRFTCDLAGIPQEDIIEINCLELGDIRLTIRERIKEIKVEQEEVTLVLDWGFPSADRDLLAEEIFYDLTEGVLEKGDAIICNGDRSQFSQYIKFLDRKEKGYQSIEVNAGNRMIETEGILIISPKDWSAVNGLNEIIRFKLEGKGESNLETSRSGIEKEL